MLEDEKSVALKEIHKTLKLCNFCARCIGISFTDDGNTKIYKILTNLTFIVTTGSLLALIAAEVAYLTNLLMNTTTVEAFVSSLHIVGYGFMSVGKMTTLWYKQRVFRQLVTDLVDIWPTSKDNQDIIEMKRSSFAALRFGQFWYAFCNGGGGAMYYLMPLGLYIYRYAGGAPADLGYVWHALYPIDKTKPVYHELVYFFEVVSSMSAIWSMLASDMLFTTMASHIGMLLRILQKKIRRILTRERHNVTSRGTHHQLTDCYTEIVSVIKIHQRLISYSNELENAFTVVNLINVLLSSVNICCVVFVIVLLEPWMAMGNKFYLGAALSQMGIICWYADDIYTASIGVADAAYESGWYESNTRCRRALLVLIQRSQKPLYFTALKFSTITMTTFSSILTTSYSYFALLYTAYRGK